MEISFDDALKVINGFSTFMFKPIEWIMDSHFVDGKFKSAEYLETLQTKNVKNPVELRFMESFSTKSLFQNLIDRSCNPQTREDESV